MKRKLIIVSKEYLRRHHNFKQHENPENIAYILSEKAIKNYEWREIETFEKVITNFINVDRLLIRTIAQKENIDLSFIKNTYCLISLIISTLSKL